MIEEKRFILRGFAVGAFAGLLAFVFSRIFAEPQVQKAIDYESARDAMQATLDRAAHLPVPPAGPDIFSRSIQQNIGVGVGLLLFGVALGGLFSVAYILLSRRYPELRPRTLAVLVAVGGFAVLYLLPALKYPANPPSIGHPDTIKDRSGLYVVMVLISLVTVLGALSAFGRLTPRLGGWNAALVSLLGIAVVIGVATAILPPLGHLHANVTQFGRHATETPLPLTDAHGRIVFPGFPADVLFKFRLYSLMNQMVLWGTIGLAFGPLAERMLRTASDQPAVRTGAPVTSPAA